MTNQQPAVNTGPNILVRGAAVAVLAIAVLTFAVLAIIDPASLISLAPEWFGEPGASSVLAGAGLAGVMAGLLYKAVREGNRGHDELATWLTLAALLIVPIFSMV
ncbi:hypothetical protein [Actinoplanes xinjiangensis]|uniref:Uncharacterized protein n=1 Tax=Actinoplanes xinjiangensis TaxID=512350 RepID=A0A316FR24_9ACTN|nr:hypothetical protein [Actinoplanes xinjiangensis]PWK51231.1 hypothetical protein BC793_102259 [Actinoplanes xinjiangensis]GIF39784.1 hypothetical protein Axi01nite_40950 [Actinoplanes xinjiangensis]